jgi:hypothetical protein
VKLAPYSYVIPDDNVGQVPNVGIVVGSQATLVIDPGMGIRLRVPFCLRPKGTSEVSKRDCTLEVPVQHDPVTRFPPSVPLAPF